MKKKVHVIIEALEVVTLTQGCKRQRLEPGDWTILSEAQLAAVLQVARGKVKIVCRRTIEDTAPSSGAPLSPVYWKRRSGAIEGPATVDPFVSAGLWRVIEHDGEWSWVHSGSLRSQLDFEQQRLLPQAEPIRERKEPDSLKEDR